MKNLYTILSIFLSLAFIAPAIASDIAIQGSSLYPFRNTVQIQEDFASGSNSTGTLGVLGWFNAGPTGALIASETNAPGLYRKSTTAASGTVSALLMSGQQNLLVNTGQFSFRWLVRVNTIDANTLVRVGSSAGCTVTPISSGIYFEKLDGDTNWFAVTRTGGTETRTDTTVAVAAAFQDLGVIHLTSALVEFRIAGNLVATHTTNVPTISVTPCLQIVNSAAADKSIDVDYFELFISNIAR